MKHLLLSAGLGLLLATRLAAVGEPLLKQSPFLPPEGPAKPFNAPAEFEFRGVIAEGPKALVSITRVSTKRSLWIPVGSTVDGIEVLSHDPKTDNIIIRAAGETTTLALKVPAPFTGAQAPRLVPLPAGTLPPGVFEPPPPTTTEEKEREARLLVSDLLEIGMQQRKAYEEAQRKASREAAKRQSDKSAPARRDP